MKELLTIQQKLKAPKGQTNKFGGYKYRSAEDVLEALKPLLGETKCTLTISDSIVMVGDWIYVEATAELKNSSGESVSVKAYAREPETKKGSDVSQITGAASSYARKYALNGLFAIDDTKDADYDGGSKQTAEDDSPKLATTRTLNTLQKLSEEVIAWSDEYTPDRITAGIKAASKNRTENAAELFDTEAKWLIGKLKQALGEK